MTSALYWLTLTALLTAVIAFPYVLERIARIGLSSNPRYQRGEWDERI